MENNNLLPLEVNNLYFVKGKRVLLSNISCKIKSRGITIILGPNGAGKTLFLKCLHGLIIFNNSNIKAVFDRDNNINQNLKDLDIKIEDDYLIVERQINHLQKSKIP